MVVVSWIRSVGNRHVALGMVLALALALCADTRGQTLQGDAASEPDVALRLIADRTAWQPGMALTLGIVAEVPAEWHVYWLNPGDAGLPPEFTWTLPEGFSVTLAAWPVPQTHRDAGIVTYGYEGEVTWVASLDCPADADATADLSIAVTADWLVCHPAEGCVEARSQAQMTLPDHESEDTDAPASDEQPHLQAVAASLPTGSAAWQARLADVGDGYVLRLRGRETARPEAWPDLAVFAFDAGTLAAEPRTTVDTWEEGVDVRIGRDVYAAGFPASLRLLIVGPEGWFGEAGRQGLLIDAVCVDAEALDAPWPAWPEDAPDED